MSYTFKVYDKKLNKVQPVTIVYGDEVLLSFQNYNLDQSEASFASASGSFKISYSQSNDTQSTETVTLSTNTASVTVDSSLLPTSGKYKYQLSITDGGLTYTLATGEIRIEAIIE